MKHLIFLLILISLVSSAQAMERETLVGSDNDIEHGGMGGVMLSTGMVADELQIMVGGRGAWLLDHQLYVGGAGYGITQDILANDTNYNVGFGGLMIGYIFQPHRLIHFGTEIVVGGGGIGESYDGYDYDSHHHRRGDALFYTEPSVYASLNLAKYAKINAGVSYRYVMGSDTAGITDEDLRGVNAQLSVMFGKF